MVTYPWDCFSGAVDWLDERAALRKRRAFGKRGWLLSWYLGADRRWRARLSGPEIVHTIERSGPTRASAIARSARALHRLPELRETVRDRMHALTGLSKETPTDPE